MANFLGRSATAPIARHKRRRTRFDPSLSGTFPGSSKPFGLERLRPTHAIETLRTVRGLRVGELVVAGTGRCFDGAAEIGPGVQRPSEACGRQHTEAHVGGIGKVEACRAVDHPVHSGEEAGAGGIVNAFDRAEIGVKGSVLNNDTFA